MVLKIILTEHELNQDFFVLNFGYEEISENARWNKGLRDVHIIHYVLTGEGFFNSMPVKAGEGFYVGANVKCEYHTSDEKPWRYFWVAFAGEAAENIAKKYVQTDENGIFEFNLNSKFMSLFENITAEDSPVSATRAIGYFYFLTSYHGKSEKSFKNRYVEEAKRYMNLNLSSQISITDVAAAVGVNDRYLYNLFIKYEGVSPKRYLSELRLSRSELMLKSTSFSITEIAEGCGFPDVLSFSRFFSKNKAVSPSKFRSEVS